MLYGAPYQSPYYYLLGGTMVKNLLSNAREARDTDLISGSGKSPGGGNGNPL